MGGLALAAGVQGVVDLGTNVKIKTLIAPNPHHMSFNILAQLKIMSSVFRGFVMKKNGPACFAGPCTAVLGVAKILAGTGLLFWSLVATSKLELFFILLGRRRKSSYLT